MKDYDEIVKNLIISKENDNLGLTQEYDRNLYDDYYTKKDRKEFVDNQFGDKKSMIDPITKEIIHKDPNAAKNKYHMKDKKGVNISKEWAKHSPEGDHIVALEDAHRIAKLNPFLTDDDFKEIMNQESNYRVLPKVVNASKQSQSDIDIIKAGVKKKNNVKKQGEAYYKDNQLSSDAKLLLLQQKLNAETKLQGDFLAKTAKNMSNEATIGAVESLYNSVIPLTVNAVDNMCKVAYGEYSLSEGIKKTGKDIVNVAVVGGTQRLVNDVVEFEINKMGNQLLGQILSADQCSQIVNVALLVKDSAIRYVSGEITGEQFIEEVGEKGTKMVVGMIGGQIGSEIGLWLGGLIGTTILPGIGSAGGAVTGYVIGKILGTIITTVSCSAIIAVHQTFKHIDDHNIYKEIVIKLEKEALLEIENQRNTFKSIVENEFKKWDENIYEGFNLILTNSCKQTFDFYKVTEGIDMILGLFNSKAEYHSVEEYKKSFGNTKKLKF